MELPTKEGFSTAEGGFPQQEEPTTQKEFSTTEEGLATEEKLPLPISGGARDEAISVSTAPSRARTSQVALSPTWPHGPPSFPAEEHSSREESPQSTPEEPPATQWTSKRTLTQPP